MESMNRLFAGWVLLCGPVIASSAATNGIEVVRATWTDAARKRDVPVTVYLPAASSSPAPVILFSHGLGGSRDGYAYLGKHWASNGFVSVHLQHLGSDAEILRGAKRPVESLREAILNPKNTVERPKDVAFALDELTRLNAVTGPFQGRLDLKQVGVAGHSFGAHTAISVAGMAFPSPGWNFTDNRVTAAVVLSPTTPRTQPEKRFGEIRIPVMHMTGTADDSPVGDTMAKDRRVSFDLIHGVPQVLVTLAGGDHMVFSGMETMLRDASKDAIHHGLILEGTTAFWNATLKSDTKAAAWLADGGYGRAVGTNGVLELKGWKSGK